MKYRASVALVTALLAFGAVASGKTFKSDGFSCEITDAGVVRNLAWKGTRIAEVFSQIVGDATLEGAPDRKLSFSQGQAGRGKAVFSEGADGSLTSVTEFPVKGASGTEYFKLKVTTVVSGEALSVSTHMTRSRDFKFGGTAFRGDTDWQVEMYAGGTADFISWDDKHTVKSFTSEFTPGNSDTPGSVKVAVSGKRGDWVLAVSGGYFSNLSDTRKWGEKVFRQAYVQQGSVTWGGTRAMAESSDVSITLHVGEKIDAKAVAKAKEEEKRREAERAAAEAERLKPIVADFPTRDEMWSFADAGREKTACRERISLNGLWAFKVDNDASDLYSAPTLADFRHFFKVPGKWPEGGRRPADGMAVYNAKGVDVFGVEVKSITSAWYARSVEIPASWRDRRVVLCFRWIPSVVMVYVDGKRAGEVFFPGGEVDLSSALTPGRHEVAFFTSAKLPEKLVQVFDAPDQARVVTKKSINNKGINGDIYIAAEPKGLRIDDVQVRSKVADGRIEFSVGFAGEGSLSATAVADVFEGGKKVKTFKSAPFTASTGSRQVFGGEWKDAKVWDVDCPQNVYTVRVSVLKGGKAADESYAEEFGFREVTIRGRELLLNGKPLHLRPEYSCHNNASAVSNESAEDAFRRMRRYGFNFNVDGSYGFAEGSNADFEMSVRAASKVGMLSVMDLPHPCRYAPPDRPLDWNLKGAYENLVRYEVKRLQNIPGLVLWSSTHNQTGYEADQNPELMTGLEEDVPDGIVNWRKRFRENSKAVDRLLAEVDPGRPIYHHESGRNGRFYTLNSYLDWAPIQERSDWLETWEEKGVMPLLIVEWGAPHIASWASYRGEDSGRNIWSSWGSCKWLWLNEYNAAFLGEEAFHLNPRKSRAIELIEYHCKGNKNCYYGAWDEVTTTESDTKTVMAAYLRRNIRDMRARGITMILPWDIRTTHFKRAEGSRERKVRENPLAGIKGFGVVRSDYTLGCLGVGGQVPTKTGEVMVETYADIIGWIAGPGREFTTVNDSYIEGETVEKSLVFVNDQRHDRTIAYAWKAGSAKGAGKVKVKAGGTAQVPFSFKAESSATKIVAEFRCAAAGWRYRDSFALSVAKAKPTTKVASVALFDPEGTAKPLFAALGVKVREVSGAADSPRKGEVLVVGRNAYSKLPFDLRAAAGAGAKVVVLEQDAATLKKLGFRVQEHALRNLFPNDAAFSGLDLTDWRGVSTSLPWFIGVDRNSGGFPRCNWEGFDNTRVWRAGNRGAVASTLPEKPARGDYRALLSGGFNLQYAPVMEYSSAGVRVVFSQLDLCGRLASRCGAPTVAPEALSALARILDYAARPIAPAKGRVLVMEGGTNVASTFQELGIKFEKAAAASDAKPGDVLVLGPGAKSGDVTALVESGVNVLALALMGDETAAVFPSSKPTKRQWGTYADYNAQIGKEPLFSGVSNADIQWNMPSCMAHLAKFNEADILTAVHSGKGVFVYDGVTPWRFAKEEKALRHNRRRAQALVTRLVANLGGAVAEAFPGSGEALYADKPLDIDDPYRYFRW